MQAESSLIYVNSGLISMFRHRLRGFVECLQVMDDDLQLQRKGIIIDKVHQQNSQAKSFRLVWLFR